MRALILTLILLTSTAQAGLRHLGITNMHLEYGSSRGMGSVEKISIGLSKGMNYPLEVERIENTFVVKTPMLDFTWLSPWKFLLNAETISLSEMNLNAGNGKHDLTLAQGKLLRGGEIVVRNATAHCEGTSELPDLDQAIMEDCRDNMKVEADSLDIPIDSVLTDILVRLPQFYAERPLKNFYLTSKDGDFYMYFLANYVVKAGLRTWGAFHWEDERKTLVIRVDLIKFGILPVTGMVMKELKTRVKDPDIEINPPLIKIKL